MKLLKDEPFRRNWISRRRSNPESLKRRYGVLASELLDALRPGDEIRSFKNSKRAWSMRCGRRGYVLLKYGEVIKAMITAMT
jgi:hypothetical protein